MLSYVASHIGKTRKKLIKDQIYFFKKENHYFMKEDNNKWKPKYIDIKATLNNMHLDVQHALQIIRGKNTWSRTGWKNRMKTNW